MPRAQLIPSGTSSFTSDSKLEDTVDARDPTSDLAVAVQLIKACRQGILPPVATPEWRELHISPAQFMDLRQQLEDEDQGLLEFFENWLRWDYSPARGILVLRVMATALHETLQDAIFLHICGQLDQHLAAAGANEPVFTQVISNIQPCGHVKVRLGYTQGVLAKKSPDSQLRYLGRTRHPRLCCRGGIQPEG